MRNVVFIGVILLCGCCAPVQGQPSADSLYRAGNMEQAQAAYFQLLEEKGNSANIWINIGNCQYRLKNYIEALASYERALLIEPFNKTATYNSDLSRYHVSGEVRESLVVQYAPWKKMSEKIGLNGFAWMCILSVFCVALALFFNYFSHKKPIKILTFSLGIFFLLSFISALFLGTVMYRSKQRKFAIVHEKEANLFKGKDAEGNVLSRIKAGTRVELLKSEDGWWKVNPGSGNEGWIQEEDLIVLF